MTYQNHWRSGKQRQQLVSSHLDCHELHERFPIYFLKQLVCSIVVVVVDDCMVVVIIDERFKTRFDTTNGFKVVVGIMTRSGKQDGDNERKGEEISNDY